VGFDEPNADTLDTLANQKNQYHEKRRTLEKGSLGVFSHQTWHNLTSLVQYCSHNEPH